MATGFFVGRWIKLYPIEAAIVNACHSGQGGTGDVAILTAANRMQLMPFAQIATRIGGAVTVTLALIAMARLGALDGKGRSELVGFAVAGWARRDARAAVAWVRSCWNRRIL